MDNLLNFILTLISAAFVAHIKVEHATNKFKMQETYKIKKEAIFETLQFLDDYISWMTFENNTSGISTQEQSQIRKPTSTEELTFQARICYNKLCTTCDSQEIVDYFNDIVFDKQNKKEALKIYHQFRLTARKELGLQEIHLNPDIAFISKVDTKDLSETRRLYICRDIPRQTTRMP